MAVPRIRSVVLDCPDARALAEFYRELLGLAFRPGDETPAVGEDWLVLLAPQGIRLAFQQIDDHVPPTWPAPGVPQQLHLDTSVPTAEELRRQRDRALALGAQVLHDRFDHPDEPLYVFADPAGHPFCIFVAAD